MIDDCAVKISGITHYFQNEDGGVFNVLQDVSFSVKYGEFFTILGPSGCGKSTLLKITAGTIKPSVGAVNFGNYETGNGVSMVFQSFAIFPWLTVRENVEFGLKMKGVAKREKTGILKERIEEMGLEGFENVYPRDLSGGMKQRVGIARALAVNPKLLLMDEPFSSLDAFTAERLRKDVLELWLKNRITTIMVTHLVEEAVEMSDRVLVMTPRPGKVEAVVPVAINRPRLKRSKDFFDLCDKITAIVGV